RAAEPRHGPDVDHLVHRRGQRDARAGHPREAWAPHTARDDHGLSLDVTVGRAHPAHVTPLDVDADDLGLRSHVQRAGRLTLLAHQGPRAQRVDDAYPLGVETAEDDLLVD